jgi:RNA ligase (TIGR02306 family)
VTTPKSDFVVELVTIQELTKHPNADKLSLVNVNGNTVVVRTEDWKVGDYAIYVPVDALVDKSQPEFNFLQGTRIKAARLRGVFSQGLLVSAKRYLNKYGLFDMSNGTYTHMLVFPEGSAPVTPQEFYGITKWLSPTELKLMGVEQTRQQVAKSRLERESAFMPVYGLDPGKKYAHVLQEGEQVVITEKIHGCNARYAFHGGRLFVGSHRAFRGASVHRVVAFLQGLWLRLARGMGVQSTTNEPGDGKIDVWWEGLPGHGVLWRDIRQQCTSAHLRRPRRTQISPIRHLRRSAGGVS